MDELTTIAWQQAVLAILRNMLSTMQTYENRIARLEAAAVKEDKEVE